MMTLDTILSSFLQPTFWHWFTAAVLFLILELILPTTFVMWTGIGAFFTGLLVLLKPDIDWSLQLTSFAIFSLISIVIGRKWLKKSPIESDEPLLNRRAEQYLGRVATLIEPIVNGVGHISLDDTRWRIEGPDLQPGDQIKVTDMNGSSLVVERYQGE